MITEVFRLISELHSEFSKRKEDLPNNLLKLNQLSTTFQKCLETIPDSFDSKEEAIDKMNNKYEQLMKEKELYEKFIQLETIERELEKEKSFQISSVNIKLQKFKDYSSELDSQLPGKCSLTY